MTINARQRDRLSNRLIVYPKGNRVGGRGRDVYPIDTLKRARAALAYSARKNTPGSYSTVARKVRAVYGDRIAATGPTRGTTRRAGYKRKR